MECYLIYRNDSLIFIWAQPISVNFINNLNLLINLINLVSDFISQVILVPLVIMV